MKRFIFIALIFLLSACAPSQSIVQTAIANTQAAWTPTPTPAPTKTLTPVPTRTKAATRTPTDSRTTYILETGWCLLEVGEISGKDPKTVKYCSLDARQQVNLASNESVVATLNTLDGSVEVYCAIFKMDGTFIMSDVDTKGSGKVTCIHP
jgi:hypothetical protein